MLKQKFNKSLITCAFFTLSILIFNSCSKEREQAVLTTLSSSSISMDKKDILKLIEKKSDSLTPNVSYPNKSTQAETSSGNCTQSATFSFLMGYYVIPGYSQEMVENNVSLNFKQILVSTIKTLNGVDQFSIMLYPSMIMFESNYNWSGAFSNIIDYAMQEALTMTPGVQQSGSYYIEPISVNPTWTCPPPPPKTCEELAEESMRGIPVSELAGVEVLESTPTDRTIRFRNVIFRSIPDVWRFMSFDIAKHKKVNGQWIFFQISHENVALEGTNAGSQMVYYDEFNPEAKILNDRNASVEFWFGIRSLFYCGGHPIESTFIKGANSRLLFPITD